MAAHVPTVLLLVSPLMPASGDRSSDFHAPSPARNLIVIPPPRPSSPEQELSRPLDLIEPIENPESSGSSIPPREAVRGRVRDHPGQAVHPLGRRLPPANMPRRSEPPVTENRTGPSTDHRIEDEAERTPPHEQLQLERLLVQVQETKPVMRPPTVGKWSMSWRPDRDPSSRDSQHPAAKVAEENAAAANAQPSIPVALEPAVEAEVAVMPKAPQATENHTDLTEPPPKAEPTEMARPTSAQPTTSRALDRTARLSPLAAAGWLLAAGLSVAWVASSMRDVPPMPNSNALSTTEFFGRPVGVSPDAESIDRSEAIRISESRVGELESETAELRLDLGLRDSELQSLRSTSGNLTAALAEALEDAAYTARERVLLHEELEAALSLLEAADADR